MELRKVKFKDADSCSAEFYQTLNKRVKGYFIDKKISPHANPFMIFKLFFCLILFFGLYFFIISDYIPSDYILIFVFLFGVSSTFVGFNIGHDAVHGAIFRSMKWNRIFSYSFELIGMSSYAWYLKHNLVHHNNPNVQEADFDIEVGPILRFSPADKLLACHRYQHLYAPVVYLLFSLVLVFYNDFLVLFINKREGIDSKKHPLKEKLIFGIAKMLYLFFMLALPIMVMDYLWWEVLLGFVMMHFSLSTLLAFVLIPAHIFEHTHYPTRSENGTVESNWAIHQMQTTMDYSRESKLWNFLLGGLNINVVHHLFPRICHVHLIPVSKIVKETAAEFGVTYHEASIWGAVASHFKALRLLGRVEKL